MYTPEELHQLLWILGGAALGRFMKFRNNCYQGTFSCRVIARIVDWVWELPVLIAVSVLSYEVTSYYNLADRTAITVAIILGFIGLDVIKMYIIDYAETKFGKHSNRNKSDEQN